MEQKDLLRTPQAEQLLKNREKVVGMMNSPDAQKLMRLLQQQGGDRLEGAAQAAMKGEPDQLMKIVKDIMASSEGAQTVDRIHKTLQK